MSTQVYDVRPEQVAFEEFDRLMQGDPTKARPTDPFSSHLAALSISPEGMHDSQVFVLRFLVERGRSEAWRIEQAAFGEWSGSRVRTALVELEAQRLVRRYSLDGMNAKGRIRVDRFEAIR